MSSETDQPQDVTSPPDAPVQEDSSQPQVIQPSGKKDEDKEVFQWPYTEGEMGIMLSHFNITGVPEMLEDEKTSEGKMVLVLMSEILRLSRDVHDLLEAVKYLSLQQHLGGQGGSGGRKVRRF
jgi:hypothetical protein